MQRGKQLEEELKMRDQELENTMSKQKEVSIQMAVMSDNAIVWWENHRSCLCPQLETRVRQLSCEQVNVKEQNQQLRSLNVQLQDQMENSREQLQAALGQLSLLQLNAAQEQGARQRWEAQRTAWTSKV